MDKTPSAYREEAEKYVALARRAETPEIRHHLIEIARHYAQLAAAAARKERV